MNYAVVFYRKGRWQGRLCRVGTNVFGERAVVLHPAGREGEPVSRSGAAGLRNCRGGAEGPAAPPLRPSRAGRGRHNKHV